MLAGVTASNPPPAFQNPIGIYWPIVNRVNTTLRWKLYQVFWRSSVIKSQICYFYSSVWIWSWLRNIPTVMHTRIHNLRINKTLCRMYLFAACPWNETIIQIQEEAAASSKSTVSCLKPSAKCSVKRGRKNASTVAILGLSLHFADYNPTRCQIQRKIIRQIIGW